MENSLAARLYKQFDGRLAGTIEMKQAVLEALLLLPSELQDFVTAKCWILSSSEEAWAFTFSGDDLAGMHLIFLSDDLLIQSPEQIRYTILHEIGHVVLGHRNSTRLLQSRREVNKQEKQAHDFAASYLR